MLIKQGKKSNKFKDVLSDKMIESVQIICRLIHYDLEGC